MSKERIAVKEVMPPSSRPWNRDGYLPKVPVGSQVLKAGLGSIRVLHPYEEYFLRLSRESAGGMQIIRNYHLEPMETVAAGHLTVEAGELNWPEAESVSVTDVFLSPEMNRLYVLDADATEIHRLRIPGRISSGTFEREKVIRLSLPPKVALTPASRITVVPRIEEEPEKRDPFFYVSAPGSHVILKVDAETGVAIVAFGTPGRPGITRTGTMESPTFLRYPSAIFFDEPEGLFYWADSGNRAVFSARGQIVTQVASFPSDARLTSLLVYRLRDHVDAPLILQRDEDAIAPDWEETDPTLLFAADSLSCRLYKVCLHSPDRSPKQILDFTPMSASDPTVLERLMALQNGDLLVTTNSNWVYHVLQTTKDHSSSYKPPYGEYAS